jgi:hypothetical protein
MLLPAPGVAVASAANQSSLHMAPSHSSWATSALMSSACPAQPPREALPADQVTLVINPDVVYRTADLRDAECAS